MTWTPPKITILSKRGKERKMYDSVCDNIRNENDPIKKHELIKIKKQLDK